MKIRNRIRELRQVRAGDLVPNPKNWRTHPQAQQDALKGILAEIGYADALLARELDDGSLMLVDGHLRAETTPDQEVPVLVLDIDEAEAGKLLLSLDPLAALAETNAVALDALLRQVDTGSEGLQQMYADMAEAADLYQDDEKEVVEDEVPEPPADPITKPGDLWLLGDHRLLCGDSAKAEDVERLMARAKARYGMFDPPYGIAVIGGVSKAKGSIGGVSKAKANEYEPIHGDDKPFDPAPFFGLAEECVWWGANYFADKLPCKKGWIVWDKKGREWNDNFSDCEMAWTPFKTVARIYRHVWVGLVQEGERELRQHPTQKPVALFVKLMRELFADDGVVLDLWLGSGTTLIAAEQLGRKCYGMEISPAYCDVIVKRWETLTGKKAKLEKRNGKTRAKA